MQCDVVVIGAGPSGSATAYWLARAGIDVLLTDKAHFPRNKPCGDGLTPRTIKLLKSMGLANLVLKRGWTFTGVRIFAPDGYPFHFSFRAGDDGQPRQGVVIPRRDLDDILRQQAISAGARFLPGFVAMAPYHRRGRLAGVQGRCEKHLLTIKAQLIIIATGANRKLVRALGLSDEDGVRALALRAYMAGLQGLDDHLEIYLDRKLLPGYAWVFPTEDGTANVGVGIRLNGITTAEGSRQLRAAFARFLNTSRLAGGKLLGHPQGSPLRTDFPAIPLYAPGVLVVGEAAGLVNPLTGEGIALALESGQLAAEVAIEGLLYGNLSGDRLRRYDHILRERHAGYFKDARDLMGRLAHPKVIEALVQCFRADERVREALTIAIVEERPRDGIVLLGEVLGSANGHSLAKSLFTINAYRPLLDRCRAYMLSQVSLDTPSSSVLEMLKRGKMLRALLVFLGCKAAGGNPVQVLTGAAGIELVHAASLIHDDIMDSADTRRGLPALHTTLGTSRAIVCGDYLIAKAFRLLAESRTTNPAAQVVEAFIIGSESGISACRGQFSDVGSWTEEMLNEESYDQLIANKTAAVIAGALMAGAALAGGDRSLLDALARYAECVGRAFQIRDDLLDFVNASVNGCPRDRRLSLPLIHAFQHSDDYGRELIRRFLDGDEVDGNEIAKLLQATGSLAYAEDVASSLAEEAVQLAKAVPQIQEELEAFARYVVLRDY
jgi:geranylgeranyl reductase family protein